MFDDLLSEKIINLRCTESAAHVLEPQAYRHPLNNGR